MFRGNGASLLHDAFERRPDWSGPDATPAAYAIATGVLSPKHSSSTVFEPLTKVQENLLLSKALIDGGASFVFRDLLCGPHFGPGRIEGSPPPTASLYSTDYPALDGNGQPQTVNRWPSHTSLTSKDGSLASLVRYYREQGLSPWAFVPLSFYVPNLKLLKVEPANCPAWSTVRAAHALVGSGDDPRVPCDQRRTNLWLLKPTNGSGGEGIAIGSDIAELERVLVQARSSTQGFLAQKYLEAPLLYDGRKFDLRVWAVIESDLGSPAGLRVWGYREGYARTSSERFSLPAAAPSAGLDAKAAEAAAAQTRLVHLTNYCMQVKSDKCGTHEEGNAISFDDLGRNVSPRLDFRHAVLPRIFAIVADAALAARKELIGGLREHGRGRRVCALLGYDFMVSATGVPCLIECNANPLLAAQNEWHGQLVARMVDDYVGLAADGPAAVAAGTVSRTPRPPLDGVHCTAFDGSGFQLLVGRPVALATEGPADATSSDATQADGTASIAAGEVSSAAEGVWHPMFGLRTINGVLALDRTAKEREAAAAVPEPELPPEALLPAAGCARPPPTPPSTIVHEQAAAPIAHSHSSPITLRGINAIRHEAMANAAAAHVRRLAAMRFAAAHRAKARRSV